MAKSADIRPGITLACTECKERNYITTKNRRNTPDRLELKKFCPRCGKQTVPIILAGNQCASCFGKV